MKKTQTRYLDFYDTAPAGFILLNKEGLILQANRTAAELFGITPGDELVRQPLDRFIHGTSRDSFIRHRDKLFSTGEKRVCDLRMVKKDGTIFWACLTADTVAAAHGSSLCRIVLLDITQRKLFKELGIYENIVPAIPDCVAVVDKNYRYIVVNDGYEHFTGISKEKFVGLKVAENLGEDVFQQAVKPHFDKCLQGESVNYQEWFDYPNMGERYIDVSYYPYRDAQNAITGIVTHQRDITDSKKDVDLLKARLRLSEASGALSLEALLTMAIDEAEALTGSCIGFFHFLDEDQKTITLQAWSTATAEKFCRAEGTGSHYDLAGAGVWADSIRQGRVIVHNDYAGVPNRKGLPAGHASVARELVVPVFRNEKIVGTLGVGNKIRPYTERDIELATNMADLAWDIVLTKRAQVALFESEREHREIFNATSEGIMIHDAESGRIIDVNESVLRIFGYSSKEEMFSGDVVDLRANISPYTETETQAFVDKCLTVGPQIFTWLARKKTGETFWVEVSLKQSKIGGKSKTIAVIRDITERKQAQEALQASLAEKDVLLREVHHRVKNNMAAIIGLFQLQRQAMQDPQVKTVLAELSSRVHAMSLVHEKLYRSESLARIDFHDYIQSLISHLRTSFGSPKIQCETKVLGVEMPLDLAVPCGMIINELITNALKYAFPKERSGAADRDERIRLTMSRDGDTFSLCVADNGVGLPPGFDLNTVKTLGLVLVRMLGQHQLGGRYTIDTAAGTRFDFTFSLRSARKEGD